MISLEDKIGNVKLALICAMPNLTNGEIALIDYAMAMECMGVGTGIQSYRISIKARDHQHGLRMYGSGRSDKIDGQDNTLFVSRDAIKGL